ncbi:g8708 [Coccomyxa elongata]
MRGWKHLALCLLISLHLTFSKPVLNDLMRKSPLLRGEGFGAGPRLSSGRLSAEKANMACQHDPGRGPPTPCKFFILDVSEIAQELGLPTCSDERLATDPETGMVLPNPGRVAPEAVIPEPPPDHEWIYPYSVAPHYHSQNAGPWYVYHALRNSKHTVTTIDEADVVYVYDYCYLMWILSDHHAREHWWLRDNYTPDRKTGSHLLAAYRAIMELPRWQRSGGRDFVFYHSHSGFEWDDLETTNKYQEMLCHDFQWATFIVIEQMQRWRCPTYNPRTTIVAPYSSTEVINTIPDADKELLLFFRGDCEPPVPEVVGKYMRARVIASLKAVAAKEKEDAAAEDEDYEEGVADDLSVCCHGRAAGPEVACTERDFDLNELKVQPHRPMLEAMATSVFCLILPGNSQSSQRLTEAFLTGCIPVFLGAPWHTLPFATEVDYAAAGMFLNITGGKEGGSAPWWEQPGLQMAPGLEAMSQIEERFSPAWWFADVANEAIGSMQHLESLLPLLRQMDEEVVLAKMEAVKRYRSMFIFATQPQHPPSASDIAIELMCTYAKFGMRD